MNVRYGAPDPPGGVARCAAPVLITHGLASLPPDFNWHAYTRPTTHTAAYRAIIEARIENPLSAAAAVEVEVEVMTTARVGDPRRYFVRTLCRTLRSRSPEARGLWKPIF